MIRGITWFDHILVHVRTFFLRELWYYGLSRRVKLRAEKAFYRRASYYKKRSRNPNRGPYLGRIIRGASHDAYDPLNRLAAKTKRAHWVRQKIRKYLYKRLGKDYQMR